MLFTVYLVFSLSIIVLGETMNKISLKILCDGLFTLFVVFSVTFVLLNFFMVKPFSVIVAIGVSVILATLYSKRSYEKTKNYVIKKKDEIKINEMLGELGVMKKQKVIGLFLKAFNKNNIFVVRRNGGLYSPKEKTFYVFHFGFSLFDKNDVVATVNKLNKNDCAVVFTHQVKDSVVLFANRLNRKIDFKLSKDVYSFLLKANCLPPKTLPDQAKLPFFSRLKKGMIKKRAPKIFAFGLFFIFSSFFVTYKIYYAIVGSFFLISSLLITLFGGKGNTDN